MWTHGPDPAPHQAGKARASTADEDLPQTPSETLPSDWCGTETYSDNKVNELDNGPYKYHALYLLPADGPDQLAHVADDIQHDSIEASALIERLYSRAIRFDMGTDCGRQYIDITTLRLPQTTSQLVHLAKAGRLFDQVRDDIGNAGYMLDDGGTPGLPTNYVAWLDGPSPGGMCGQAELYPDERRTQDNLNNTGGKVAVIYNAGSGLCGASVVRHEIGHTLGAVQPDAPHAFDGSHCDDAMEDTMCEAGPIRGNGNARDEYFDYGNDDYWSPPGGAPLDWWTLDLSRFLCYDPACNTTALDASTTPAAKAGPGDVTPGAKGTAAPKQGGRAKTRRLNVKRRSAKGGAVKGRARSQRRPRR